MDFADLVEVGARRTPRRTLRWLAMLTILVLGLAPAVREKAIAAWTGHESRQLMERIGPVLPTPSEGIERP
ncbi:hypothetical protein ASE25_11420 [Terrabacter sp. Root85]|uniref:hypothetical protein n=1 Tax=Terrabacter sp. Root85 TaxID=1736603 RepID=UPI0006F6FD5D|nr:hypothetical protein [Terrabacter sp. Root85]KRC90091.1 hypothetical protein ASE25_11420 [Terrabacter sp. Root85]